MHVISLNMGTIRLLHDDIIYNNYWFLCCVLLTTSVPCSVRTRNDRIPTLLHRVFQEESATLWEYVSRVNLHPYNHTYLHAKLKGYGDNDAKKNEVFKCGHSCSSTYSTRFTCCIIATLLRSVAGPTAKPRHTEASVLCKALVTPRTTFIKIVRTFLINSCLYVIHISNVKYRC